MLQDRETVKVGVRQLHLMQRKVDETRRRWRIVGILNFQKSPLTISLAYDTS